MTGSSPARAATVLVTGGTGFFGRFLVEALAAAGHDVRVVSRNPVSSRNQRISVLHGDLTSGAGLRAALEGCNAVFHCAAEKRDPRKMVDVNVLGTKMLLDASNDARISLFCHLSSVGVFGKVSSRIVDETAACRPMNEYEKTKLAAEEIASAGLADGRIVILRPTNIFGPATLAALCRNSRSAWVRLFLKGNERSHFVYVKDVVAAAMHWLQTPERERVATFIVSSDEDRGDTHREIQAVVAARVPAAPRAPRIAAPVSLPYFARVLRDGQANVGDVIYSSRKLRAAGFRFPYGLKAGLGDALSLV